MLDVQQTPVILEDIVRLIYYHWAAEALGVLAFVWSVVKWVVPIYTRLNQYIGARQQIETDYELHRHAETGQEPLYADGILFPRKPK